MPEAPEVRRVYEDLRAEIGDSTVTQLQVFGGRFLKKSPPGLDEVKLPTKVVGGGVKGKFMWLEFETGSTMWITLGMSGYWSTEADKHAHFGIGIDNDRGLYFIDQRRFGTIKFSHDRKELDRKLNSLGVDLLNNPDASLIDFTRAMMKHYTKPICEVLMNQGACAGVGNYIKCEVLYRARISPHRPVGELKTYEFSILHKLIREIMEASYRQGGASIRNYQRVGGELGEFVFEFEVYSQKTDPHGNEVVRELTSDGRTTHWVPALQS
jgi:formamidopyrimidine-DNA glycosylase